MKPYKTLRLLFIVNFALVYLAIRNYGEHFQFWAFPLSSLGGNVTMNGQLNAASQRIFDLDMFLSAVLMFVHGIQIRSFETYPSARYISAFSFTAGGGFLLAMSPHNLPGWGTFHAVGAGAFVVSLCIIAMVHLASLRGDLRQWYYCVLQLILVVLVSEFEVQRKYADDPRNLVFNEWRELSRGDAESR